MENHGTQYYCDNAKCKSTQFLEDGEDILDMGWVYTKTEGLFCEDCWNSQENTRDEQAKLSQAEEIEFDSRHPYTSAIRDSLNNGGGIKCPE